MGDALLELQVYCSGDDPALQLPEHQPAYSGTYLGASDLPIFSCSLLLPSVTWSNTLAKSGLSPNQKGGGVTALIIH